MKQPQVVYVVQHAREVDDGNEDVKLIGVFSTKRGAERAIVNLTSVPGFSAFPDGFSVDEYEVDRVYWADGFVTMWSDDA